MDLRHLLETGARAVATALQSSPVTRTVVGPWQPGDTATASFAQAHYALYGESGRSALTLTSQSA